MTSTARSATARVLGGLLILLLALFGGGASATASAAVTTANSSPGNVYDVPAIARAVVHHAGATEGGPEHRSSAAEGFASGEPDDSGRSTTPSSQSVATNTAQRLNLPFRDAGLRSQVDDVVRNFDEFGTPPAGVAQGGLKGYPTGTYGGQGLPQKPLGYYTESDVWVSGGGVKRGAERLVFGQGGEVYYTPTHYDDFVRIR